MAALNIRGISPELLHKLRVKAAVENTTTREIVIKLIEQATKGKAAK